MTNKEAYIQAMVYHERPEFVATSAASVFCGGRRETFENGPLGTAGGKDGFGILWHTSESGAGQPVPAQGSAVLTDIADWESVQFPNLDAYDWKGEAEAISCVDRNEKVVEYSSWNAQFTRFTHLMGFMEGLCTLAEEPENCHGLMDKISDYKIQLAERAWHYFKPDFFISFDDVATQQGLFISPDLYREIVKPYHKKVNDAIRELGMYPVIHTCGRCESLIGDYIDEGNVAWCSAQPMNNIAGILEKYRGKITVVGGYDTNGLPGRSDCPEEVIDAEVKRCMETYGHLAGYVFQGFRMAPSSDPGAFIRGMAPIGAAAEKYRYF